MNSYIGLTIGPINKTIFKARSTGELWGSSYLFSYIMKKIISKLIGYGKDNSEVIISPDKFIVPNVLSDDNLTVNTRLFENPKAGLFHDRLIFESKKEDFEKLGKIINLVKKELANDIFKEVKREQVSINDISNYLNGYLKIYYVEVEVPKNQSIIKYISKYLDAIELREKYLEIEYNDYIFKMFGTDEKKNNVKNTFLTNDAFSEEKDRKPLYPSIIRIASKELNIPNDKKYNTDKELIKYLNENDYKNRIKKYHEYVALVQIDGDSMSKVLENLDDNEKCREFSSCLLKYSKDAVEAINNYGGFPIYAGGDDLLFFAPIKNSNSKLDCKNIFELFKFLETTFYTQFDRYKKDNPSISIGMEVFHQKYPLYTVLPDTASLLFDKAKNFVSKDTGNEKNAIAFKLVKSSGENFEAILNKSGQTYSKFIDIFNNISKDTDNKEIKNTLNQIHIRFLSDKKILNKIGSDEFKLKNYFDNNFNEDIHQKNQLKNFIKNIRTFIFSMYEEYGCDDDTAIKNIYSCLKFIRFINEKSDLLEKEVKNNE